MQGMMMNRPLKISDIITFSAENHPDSEIVSVRTEGDIHRTNYLETSKRIAQLANGLETIGVKPGDRIATLAWNGYRHFELYYAISGIGAVCHTINPRLSTEQLLYITKHAEDTLLFVDITFVPILEALKDRLPKNLQFIIMTDQKNMPKNILNALCYEDLLNNQPNFINWPDFSEDTAAGLCYTSGTTGEPKGTLFSHRSTVLHAMMVTISLPNALKEGNKILPVVPLFHVNAWGLPYAAPLCGAGLIFPGPKLDGESLFSLMDREKVYSAWGVPTVWLGLLKEISIKKRSPKNFKDVVIGGSAAPSSMIEAFESLSINVCHAWGMTEMSPIGTQSNLPIRLKNSSLEEKLKIKTKQGRRVFGVELKIVDSEGVILTHDGQNQGELFVRGYAITKGYFKNQEATNNAFDADGWFGTGDVATIDADGYLNILDRSKDLIKSGGEWISSLDLENITMSHPDILSCAAIAVSHPKWDERPLLLVVPQEGKVVDINSVAALLSNHFAKWQLPDDILLIESLPLTATGKVSKLSLRKIYKNYYSERV
ncbi:MAG: long-chain fatty acid--CoA ligase [Proteobacteria bacterium]|nr:long-chain fatty acid--CoA ligase [Pseudomonadota bacterium]